MVSISVGEDYDSFTSKCTKAPMIQGELQKTSQSHTKQLMFRGVTASLGRGCKYPETIDNSTPMGG